MPNGDVVAFPDEMPRETIKGLIQQKFPDVGQQQAPISKTESAIAGVGQGATANFGDEIIAGLSTPVIYGGSRLAEKMGYNTHGLAQKSLKDTYRAEQQKNQAGVDAAQQANPGTFLAGNIGGSIIGAGKIAKAVPSIPAALKMGSLPVRMVTNGLAAGTSAALSGAGAANPGQMKQGAIDAAKFGAPLGVLGPVIGKAANKIFTKAPVAASPDEIQAAASKAYKFAENNGGIVGPKLADNFLDHIESIKPAAIAGKVLTGEDQKFIKNIDEFKDLRGSNLSLSDIDRIDKSLGSKIDNALAGNNGKVNNEARQIMDIQSKFRNSVDNIAESDVIGGKAGFEAMKEGRRLWSRAAKLRDVEKIITRSEMTDNPATSIKRGFANLYQNDKKLRGFNSDEKKMIKSAATSGVIGDTFRTVLGSRLIPIGSALTGNGIGGVAASQIGTMAARGAATRLQLSKAQKLADAIANKALPPSIGQTPRNFQFPVSGIGSIGSSAGVPRNKKQNQ